MTELENRLRRSLRSTADATPIPDLDIDSAAAAAGRSTGLSRDGGAGAATAVNPVSRRPTRGRALASALAVAATVSAVLVGAALVSRDVGTDESVPAAGGGTSTVTGSAESPDGRPEVALPAGWRWESYRTVQVAVPATWRDGGSTGQLSGQWCVEKDRPTAAPVVGRPGVSTAAGCVGRAGGDPGTLMKNAGTFLGFDTSGHARDGIHHEGDRTTVTIEGVSVLIQAPAALRDKIARTVSTFVTDPHGCPATHPISAAPAGNPSPAVDVTTLTGVTAVSACKYALSSRYAADDGGLISSARLSGHAAAAAIHGIVKAPNGGGPNAPTTCVPAVSYGGEAIVLLVQSEQGRTQIYLRYDACDHHGFYDGTTVRTLTAHTVAPFIAGENTIGSLLMNGNMLPILAPSK